MTKEEQAAMLEILVHTILIDAAPETWLDARSTLVSIRIPHKVQEFFAAAPIIKDNQAVFESAIFNDLIMRGLQTIVQELQSNPKVLTDAMSKIKELAQNEHTM